MLLRQLSEAMSDEVTWLSELEPIRADAQTFDTSCGFRGMFNTAQRGEQHGRSGVPQPVLASVTRTPIDSGEAELLLPGVTAHGTDTSAVAGQYALS